MAILTQKHLDSFVEDAVKRQLDNYFLAACQDSPYLDDAEKRMMKGLEIIEKIANRLQKLVAK